MKTIKIKVLYEYTSILRLADNVTLYINITTSPYIIAYIKILKWYTFVRSNQPYRKVKQTGTICLIKNTKLLKINKKAFSRICLFNKLLLIITEP